jgi:hypothetical protein
MADDPAAVHGFAISAGSSPSSRSRCAASLSWAISSRAAVRAVSSDRPLAR